MMDETKESGVCRMYFLLMLFTVLFAAGTVPSLASSRVVSIDTAQALQIQLKIEGFSNGYIKLFGTYGDQNYGVDSAFVDASGSSVFARDSSIPSGMYIIVFPDQTIVQILLDTDQHFSLSFHKANVIETMKVIGCVDNELLYKNLRFEAAHAKTIDSLQAVMKKTEKGTVDYLAVESELEKKRDERKNHIRELVDNYPHSFFAIFKLAGQNPDIPKLLKPDGSVDEQLYVYRYRNEFWTGYDFSDERLLRTPVYYKKLRRFITELTPQIPDSIIKYADWITLQSKASKNVFKFTANWIAVYYKDAKILGRESVYVYMVEKFWTPDQVFWMKDYEVERLRMQAGMMKSSLIGEVGQDIKGKNENGQAVSLYGMNKPISVLYMFSYDCDNCKKETPKLVRVFNEWKEKGLGVFAICIDGEEQGWKDYLKQNGVNFTSIFDPENQTNFRAKYYVDVTPEIYVLNKDHKIIASNINSESLQIILERELGK